MANGKSTSTGKRLILSATNKGGVGKSFCMVQLLQWLKTEHPDVAFHAFDPDHANKTLLAYHGDVTSFIDVQDPDQHDQIDGVMRVLEGEVDLSLVDGLGSQHERTFQAWIAEVNLLEIAKAAGVKLTYFMVIEDDRDVVLQAKSLLERMGNSVDWVFVRNQRQSATFNLWDNSETRKLAVSLGASEIAIPRIYPSLAALLRTQTKPVGSEFPELYVMDQQRLLTAKRNINAEFEKAAKFLLP